jgi:crotonobetainyl-CoA:carnitine CoA-transferase CaiB-like acyl-CoA transferase
VDITAFWAGPIIAHPLAMLGAEVIHVEATKRPDGIRMASMIPMSEPGWWETSPFFNGTNTCKRDLTLDLQTERGRELLRRLIAQSDVVVENYSPRVMDQLGLSYEQLTSIKPDIILVRAPAFGIDGPWRERVGYAPTIDQASGLAWVTGEPGGRPKLIGAASDALGGMHGTLALLLALAHRDRTGEGAEVESAQVGTAIQFSAEQVAEFSAHGTLLTRNGNRSWTIAPQGVYRSADRAASQPGVGDDDWLAVSCDSDDQWRALCSVIGLPAADAALTVEERMRQHDRIDAAIATWSRPLDATAAADILTGVGVPAARVVPPHEFDTIPPVIDRAVFETVTKPVAGAMRVPRYPLTLTRGPAIWNREPAPTLGQHNHEILGGLLGLSDAELAELDEAGIIGTETTVYLGW